MLSDKDKIRVLEAWLDNFNEIGKIPKSLDSKITREDIEKLIMELGGLTIVSINIHLEKIRNRVHQEEILSLQKQTTNIQRGIIIIQVITVVLTLFSLLLTVFSIDSQNNLNDAQLDIMAPQFEVNIDCPVVDSDGYLKVVAKVTNHGEIGDFIYGNTSISGNVTPSNLSYQGILVKEGAYKGYNITPYFISKGTTKEYSQGYTAAGAKTDFEVGFEFVCNNTNRGIAKRECKFLNPNKVTCPYNFNGTNYVLQQAYLVPY